ncbi:ureidoglycolate lyase [Maritalea myrionectae]|uniref:Ureidoglycolate lyase n=1 Tax=Maritalea myrionectae TaxID=454601 RepID=A0A2R4M9M4_9HYPH|nr:ureidoglycolate lyase [Maritalea myrionectae]AVX02683.1 ureidoglycolate lyase [Maritalea myrionectae]
MEVPFIPIKPLSIEAFAPFGEVIDLDKAEHFPINNGMCTRYNDLATVELGGVEPRPLVNIFRGKPYDIPLHLKMVERHPLGSQAFIPMTKRPFLVIVAPDENGTPGTPLAFLTQSGQGINLKMGCWHGVLTTLEQTSDFVVIDRGGPGENLEEYFYEPGFLVGFDD